MEIVEAKPKTDVVTVNIVEAEKPDTVSASKVSETLVSSCVAKALVITSHADLETHYELDTFDDMNDLVPAANKQVIDQVSNDSSVVNDQLLNESKQTVSKNAYSSVTRDDECEYKPHHKPRFKPKANSSHTALVSMTLSFLSICCILVPASAQAPMICRTGHTVAKFKIPALPKCILPNTAAMHKPYDLSFTLFKPNLVQYQSQAYHCKIVKTKIVTHSGFFGTGQTKTTDYIDQMVSRDVCYSMVKWHTSPHGDLTQIGSLYQTDNIAKPVYHSGFKCCTDYEFTVFNAYLYATTVFKRHGEKEKVESPAGVVGHCTYLSGFCNLRNGSALLWEPDQKEK